MKIYKNPNCKKVRGSHILEVSCAYCKCFIAHYQKVGESNFFKMYNDRIIKGSIDFSQYHGALFCPNCEERIASEAYRCMYKHGRQGQLVRQRVEQLWRSVKYDEVYLHVYDSMAEARKSL